MIDGGLIGYAPGPGSLSGFQSVGLGSTLTFTDAAQHNIGSLIIPADGVRKVRFTVSLCFQVNSVPAGLQYAVVEGPAPTKVFPVRPPTINSTFSIDRTGIPITFQYSEVLIPAAGAHTYLFFIAASITVPTFTVYNATFMAEVFG